MVVFTRGSDVAAMMLLYKEMEMEMAEDLSKIAAEECANNSIKDLFIKDTLRAIKDGGKIE